jgi:hypothetical protein
MSVGQLDANITARAGSKRGMDLYSGNTESIKRDVSEMMELHQKNTATDEFYQNKYGSRWKEYQQFINTVFGLMTKEQQSINPMFQSDSISSQKGQVYRTYRLDRISKATRMDGATSMPFHYENIKMNFLPDGFTDATKPVDVTKIEDGFYSQLESVISKKIPTRATPEQIMATIDPTRGSGIKADEIKWSGIEQALPKLAVDGKVTKEALLKYLSDEGNVRFEEVTLSDKSRRFEVREKQEGFAVWDAQGNRWDSDRILPTRELAQREAEAGNSELSENLFRTKFSQHVLPGGENYREVVLTMPDVNRQRYEELAKIGSSQMSNEQFAEYKRLEKSGAPNAGYTSSHFPDIPNYVAHMRLDERTLGDGTRTLHSAEYQSDRHQAGRKKGYRGDLEAGFSAKQNNENFYIVADDDGRRLTSNYSSRENAINAFNQGRSELGVGGVADAPFRTTWPLQLFKRQLRDAVEGGFDSVSWDVGETHRDRYDMSEHIETIDVQTAPNGDKEISLMPKGDASAIMIETNKDGEIFNSSENFVGKSLEEVIGKELANKVLQTKNDEISGNNLKVGGEGMKGFYDTMLPKEIGKYVKQWGGKVEKSEIKGNAADIDTRAENIFTEWERTGNDYNKTYADAQEQAYAELGKNGVVESTPIWRIDITPEMRKISETGQTRYLPEGNKKTKERQVIGEDMVIDKGDSDTLDVIQSVNAETQMPSWKDDKPVPVSFGYDLASAPHISKFAGKVENPSTEFLDNLPYDLNRAEYGRVKSLIENGVVDHFANKMANETRVVLKDPAIAAGKGWYSRMRVKLLNALGETGRELFSQFLGATSAQTPVDENFLQTVDAHEGMKSGRYDRHRKGYLTAIKAEMNGTLNKEIVKTKSVESIKTILSKLKDALPLAKVKADKIAIYAEIKSLTKLIETPVNERTEAQRIKLYVVANDLLPRRSNGAKFNANSGAVLKVIAGVWLNNRESPKTPNFAGNLSGRTVQATIDIWAARYIRRMIYGGEGVPWRIQPKSEVGVSKEDFAFSQIVMERAARKLDMNPDDLQAILWFAEKDFWDKKKWTKNEGAKKSSFDDIFDIFFPEGKKPLSFAEGSAMIKNAREQQKAIAEKEKKDNLKAEANALGISVAALTRMKKQKN